MSSKEINFNKEIFQYQCTLQEAAGVVENITGALAHGLSIRLWRNWETRPHAETIVLEQKIAELEKQRVEAQSHIAQACEHDSHPESELFLEIRLVKKTVPETPGQPTLPIEIMSKN